MQCISQVAVLEYLQIQYYQNTYALRSQGQLFLLAAFSLIPAASVHMCNRGLPCVIDANSINIMLINSSIGEEATCTPKLIANKLSTNYVILWGPTSRVDGTIAPNGRTGWSSTHPDSIGRAISPSWWTSLRRTTHIQVGYSSPIYFFTRKHYNFIQVTHNRISEFTESIFPLLLCWATGFLIHQ